MNTFASLLTRPENQPMTVVLTRQQVEMLAGIIEIRLQNGCDPETHAILRDILAVMEQEYLRRTHQSGRT